MATLTDLDRLVMGGIGGALLDTYFANRLDLNLLALGFSTGVVGAFMFSMISPQIDSKLVMMIIGAASAVIGNSILRRSD